VFVCLLHYNTHIWSIMVTMGNATRDPGPDISLLEDFDGDSVTVRLK